MFLETIQKRLWQQYKLAKPVRDALKKKKKKGKMEATTDAITTTTTATTATTTTPEVKKSKERNIAIAVPHSVHERITNYLENTANPLSKRQWVTTALDDILTKIGY